METSAGEGEGSRSSRGPSASYKALPKEDIGMGKGQHPNRAPPLTAERGRKKPWAQPALKHDHRPD